MSRSTDRPLIFPTPLQNDFQWRNLYHKQFGACTYSPPMPKNPSTTTKNYPQRHDITTMYEAGEMEGEDMRTLSGATLSFSAASKENFLMTSSFVEDSTKSLKETQKSKSIDSPLDSLDDELFDHNLFAFLKPNYLSKNSESMGSRRFSLRNFEFDPHGVSMSCRNGNAMMNPHNLPREVFDLQRDTWTLLMDNRIMAWLEHETKEKGKTASHVRRRLLEVAVGPHPLAKLREKVGEEGLRTAQPTLMTEEVALQRLTETFSPYLAVISNPGILKRFKEQFVAGCRFENRGHGRSDADIVGLPIFSQFATWREAYEHRLKWNCTPFSYFITYDASYNYAQITALFVMLRAILLYGHTHTAACVGSHMNPIELQEATAKLSGFGGMREDVERQRFTCPLIAMQQVTEDVVLVFEQSSARTMLLMAMQVCDFLTDAVLDPETATRFFGKKALIRQSTYSIPGMPTVASRASFPMDLDSMQVPLNGGASEATAEEQNEAFQSPSLTRFSDDDFSALFQLSYWFVDAATANSHIHGSAASTLPSGKDMQLDVVNEPVPSSGNTVAGAAWRSMTSSCGLAAQSNAEHMYVQQCQPVGSLVEAIIRYEAHRSALLHQKVAATAPSLGRAGGKSKSKRSGSVRRRVSDVSPVRKNGQEQVATEESGGIADNVNALGLSSATTLLAVPLVFLTTYVRVHGATWLRSIFDRLFSILRRESVLLYINQHDFKEYLHKYCTHSGEAGSPLKSSYLGRVSMPSMHVGSEDFDNQVASAMLRLEDLICQDIEYVMNEFFGALHGRRSSTRLPQGVAALISQFGASIHLHLLQSIVSVHDEKEGGMPRSNAHRVSKYLHHLKQKRMEGRAFREEKFSDTVTARLITQIERHRLYKFLLFDSWIIPALNNAVGAGYLSENSTKHLRWNIDAFARYLKVLVNAPFVEDDKKRLTSTTTTGVSPAPVIIPLESKRKAAESNSPKVTLTLPSYITGVYDVSSGSLVGLRRDTRSDAALGQSVATLDHSSVDVSLPLLSTSRVAAVQLTAPALNSRVTGTSANRIRSESQHSHSQRMSLDMVNVLNTSHSTFSSVTPTTRHYYKMLDDVALEDVSPSLRSLNEALGLVGYDPDDENNPFQAAGMTNLSEEKCAMHVLDCFCRRVTFDGSRNMVVSEFELMPSMTALCIESLYRWVTGKQPMVEQALDAGVFKGTFTFTPYICCLSGVLMHPRSAARVLDNVYHNNRRFYNTLLKPVDDEVALSLASALVVGHNDLPLVDSNALTPLLASVSSSGKTSTLQASVAPQWEAEARKLQLHRTFLTTGAPPSLRSHQQVLCKAGAGNPYHVLHAGSELIKSSMKVVPVCFDPWWRAMVLVMCSRAMAVMCECSSTGSDLFEKWRHVKLDETQKKHRTACDSFIRHDGSLTCVAPRKASDRSRKGAHSKLKGSEQGMKSSPRRPRSVRKSKKKK